MQKRLLRVVVTVGIRIGLMWTTMDSRYDGCFLFLSLGDFAQKYDIH